MKHNHKTETKQQQRPATCSMDLVWWPVTIKDVGVLCTSFINR